MKTLIFIEKNPVTNALRDVSLELTAKASALMAPSGGDVVGVFIGDTLPTNSADLFKYGMDRLLHVLRPEYRHLHSQAFKHVMAAAARTESPDIILFGATHTGRDVAPLVASELATGLTADCTQLAIADYKDKKNVLFQTRPAFGGNILATIVTPDHRPMMATVRENVLALPADKLDAPVRQEAFDAPYDPAWLMNEFLEVIPKPPKVNLCAANIIVSGGAGVGSRDAFDLLFQLAKVLGGEVAASRAAVDFGYADHDRQVGQTGSVVRPKLYIACGISGSIQHRAGMQEAKKIIAINTDPNAPIFACAHMGIVGDVKEIVPVMIKYLKENAE